jgi:hypothetical protein
MSPFCFSNIPMPPFLPQKLFISKGLYKPLLFVYVYKIFRDMVAQSVWRLGYRLDDGCSIPSRGYDFSPCPDWLWAHPASCVMGTRGSYPGDKVARVGN